MISAFLCQSLVPSIRSDWIYFPWRNGTPHGGMAVGKSKGSGKQAEISPSAYHPGAVIGSGFTGQELGMAS